MIDKVVILCYVQVIIRLQIGLYVNHYKIPFRFLVGETISLSALKALITTAADDNLISSIFFSEKIRLDVLCELSAFADNSHEMPSLIFSEK